MKKKCDLYLNESINSSDFKFIKIFDKNFIYDEKKTYSGYLNVNIDRIKMVSLVTELRNKGVCAYSVPVEYRDKNNLSQEQAFIYASAYAESQKFNVIIDLNRTAKAAPVFWLFNIVNDSEERAGGIVRVDKLDGHIWSLLEYEEYMHDYNNQLS